MSAVLLNPMLLVSRSNRSSKDLD